MRSYCHCININNSLPQNIKYSFYFISNKYSYFSVSKCVYKHVCRHKSFSCNVKLLINDFTHMMSRRESYSERERYDKIKEEQTAVVFSKNK